MAATKKPQLRLLKPAEIEITWANGQIEYIQTAGMTHNGMALVMTLPDQLHNVVVPYASMRKFRILRAN